MERVGIINLGVGNLSNVQQASGGTIIDDPSGVGAYDRLILPGVGSFSAAMPALAVYRDPLLQAVRNGVPLLGICLGFQLFFEKSAEGIGEGLGLCSGKVVAFPPGLSPHIGWNEVEWVQPIPLIEGIPNRSFFFFVHGFFVVPTVHSIILSTTTHQNQDQSISFCSAIIQHNLIGVQFHPEKSSTIGIRFLDRFRRWSP